MPRPVKFHHIEIYRFIMQFKMENDGNSPSHREIMNAFDIRSLETIKVKLDKLKDMGLIFTKTTSTGRDLLILSGGQWIVPIISGITAIREGNNDNAYYAANYAFQGYQKDCRDPDTLHETQQASKTQGD